MNNIYCSTLYTVYIYKNGDRKNTRTGKIKNNNKDIVLLFCIKKEKFLCWSSSFFDQWFLSLHLFSFFLFSKAQVVFFLFHFVSVDRKKNKWKKYGRRRWIVVVERYRSIFFVWFFPLKVMNDARYASFFLHYWFVDFLVCSMLFGDILGDRHLYLVQSTLKMTLFFFFSFLVLIPTTTTTYHHHQNTSALAGQLYQDKTEKKDNRRERLSIWALWLSLWENSRGGTF